MKFNRNVGFVDQILRALLILDFLIFCGLELVSGLVASFLLVLSVVLAVSCITRYCPLYSLLNLSTRQEINA